MQYATDPLSATIRRIAVAGNAAALMCLVLVLAHGHALLSPGTPPPFPAEVPTQPAQRLVLIIIDGLRVDAARHSSVMPHLGRLAQHGIKQVEVPSLVPSTIAGLRAIAEGIIAPPGSFLQDFRSRSAPTGGLLQWVRQYGGRVYVAGPHLWGDLYGEWIHDRLTVFGFAADDPYVLRSGLNAVADSQWALTILHFGAPDVAAHRFGGNSEQYLDAVRWCDEAIRQLAAAAPAGVQIIVTSDHGVTAQGGHAGPESEARWVPVAAFPQPLPGRKAQPEIRGEIHPSQADPKLQTDLTSAAAAAIGLVAPQIPPSSTSESFGRSLLAGVLAAAALLFGLLILAGSLDGHVPLFGAFVLNAALFASLAFLPLFWAGSAAMATAALVYIAQRCRTEHLALPSFLLLGGALAGLLRLADPFSDLVAGRPLWLFFTALLAAGGIGRILGGWAAGRGWQGAVSAGALLVVISVLCTRMLGEKPSLSTLDVRFAFQILETRLGLPGAVAAAAIQPYLPVALALLGFGIAFRSRSRTDAPRCWGAVAAGMALFLVGQCAAASAVWFWAQAGQHLAPASLSLGLLIRCSGEVLVIFPAFAVITWWRLRSTFRTFSGNED